MEDEPAVDAGHRQRRPGGRDLLEPCAEAQALVQLTMNALKAPDSELNSLYGTPLKVEDATVDYPLRRE